MEKIIHNKIQCNYCKDIIESMHRRDFKSCKCGTVCVDGGHDYIRRGYTHSKNDFTELSTFEEVEDNRLQEFFDFTSRQE